ncbi:tyrosine-type recombinase/integrase [Lachnoclostridium edouardi]|uniref:tyrosine-type recombinase/integrase n=1 Tax=Lachnoclostridium edouardi TaxID=1926283 RepID=UPI000C7DD99A|nr:site-specific integrase [Lachnoclostridium edouardi]
MKKKTGYYMEADGRYVYKTHETYKGVEWDCKGSSYQNKELAKVAWQRNKEKRIAKINGEADQREGRVLFSKDLNDWYDLYKRHEVRSGRPRSKRTVQTDEDTITQLCKILGDYKVCDITSDIIQKYFITIAEDSVSKSTLLKRWRMLNMYFSHKYPDGGNPMTRCTLPESKQIAHIWSVEDEVESSNKRAYTANEMEALALELSKPYNYHSKWNSGDRGYSTGKALVVSMYEFLRIAELVELRVKDVLWEENMLYVRRQYDEVHKIVVPPKYNSRRKVPIMRACRSILEEACRGKEPEDLLFTAGEVYNPEKLAHEGRILQGRLRDNLTLACQRLGIEKHTPHDLRHDGISRLVDIGVKPQSVSKWAGHRSLAMTMDKYYRHNSIEITEDLEKVC